MIAHFYDKTCTIWSVWYTDDWASEVFAKTLVYENIPCDFWKSDTQNYKDNDVVREEDKENREVNLQPQYNLVTKGYNIEIFDSDWVSQWQYVINSVNKYLNIGWNIDNIQLTVSQRWS